MFHAHFCRTRDTAQEAIQAGHALLPGDVLTLAMGGTVWVVKVLASADRRGSAEEASYTSL